LVGTRLRTFVCSGRPLIDIAPAEGYATKAPADLSQDVSPSPTFVKQNTVWDTHRTDASVSLLKFSTLAAGGATPGPHELSHRGGRRDYVPEIRYKACRVLISSFGYESTTELYHQERRCIVLGLGLGANSHEPQRGRGPGARAGSCRRLRRHWVPH